MFSFCSLGLEKYMHRENRTDRPYGNAFDDDFDMTYDAWERKEMAASRNRRVRSAPDHTPAATPPPRPPKKSKNEDKKKKSKI